jgi:hypothetical protein
VPAADLHELLVEKWRLYRDQQLLASMLAAAVAALEFEVLRETHDNLVVVQPMHQEEERGEAPTSKSTTKVCSIDLHATPHRAQVSHWRLIPITSNTRYDP